MSDKRFIQLHHIFINKETKKWDNGSIYIKESSISYFHEDFDDYIMATKIALNTGESFSVTESPEEIINLLHSIDQ